MEPELDLSRLGQMILRRLKVIVGVAVLAASATALFNLTQRPVYEARALVLIEREGQNTLSSEGVKIDVNEEYLQTQYQILRSRSMAERVVEELGLDRHPDYAGSPVARVQGSVRVLPVKRSRLVHIVAEAYQPEMAARIANTLAKRFIQQNLESRSFLSREMLRILGDGERVDPTAIESLPAVVENPLIQHLKTLLSTLQKTEAEYGSQYQPRHPAMVQIQAQILETRSQLDRELRHIAESVRIQLSGQFQGNNVRVIDLALPPRSPSKPRTLQNTAIALALGLLGGFLLAFIVDQIDLTIRSPEDMEGLAKIPCLGLVHWLAGLDHGNPARFDLVWKDSRGHAAESFRNLRTAVSFRLSNVRGPSVILVTSSIMGEGKSLVSANLARAFAQNGERTLLIDGDLRRPSIHRLFEQPNETGLSAYLTNPDAGPPGVHLRDSGVNNLKLIVCGPMPDEPAELLTDQKLRPLIAWAIGEFDRVIIDSPPVFPVTDALLWAKQVHGIAFVVQASKVRVAVVTRAIKHLRENFSSVMGGILNQTTSVSIDGYSHYYYRYYRDYLPTERASREPQKAGSRAS